MNANPWKVDSIQEFCFFKCPECPFTHKKEIFFRDHASRNHPLSIAFFDECNKRNSESNAVVKEELIETENCVELDSVDGFMTMDIADKRKSYKCSKCDLRFAKKHNLKVHIRTVHEGQKPFKCTICDASFARSGNLKKHIASVHERKKPFKCTSCGVSWSVSHNCANKTILKTHVVTVHEDQKPFKCTMCDYTYSSSRSEILKKHIAAVHKGRDLYIAKNQKLC